MTLFRHCIPAWLVLICVLWQSSAQAASQDGNIEADGIWHEYTDGVIPRYPSSNSAFTLELQTFATDITSATVRLRDDASQTWDVAMQWDRTTSDGLYDIWKANITPFSSDYVYYHFRINDGAAFATLARSDFSTGEPAAGGEFLLNLTALGSFPLGATVDGGDTVFRVWCPDVEQAEVIINPQSTPNYYTMTEVADHWQVRITGVRNGEQYQYRFYRNGQWHTRNDPRAKRVDSSFSYSIVQRSAYNWEDQDWVIPDLEDSIIMEAHVGTFSGLNDGATGHPASYKDLVDKHIAHLVESGINVLQLMPLQEFPGELSWGYNPSFLFAPESVYGTPEDLKYLVNQCHKAGIAVWLDVVLNHFDGPNLAGNLGDFNGDDIYFYSAASGFRDTGFGPRPDYGRVEVRDYLVDSMRHLIEEYHIDGFRLDHTALIKVNGDGWRLMKEIAQMRDRVNPRVVLTAEQWPNDTAVTRPVRSGGAGMDAQWSDIFHDNCRAALNQLAFGDPNMNSIADALNHFGYSPREMINFIESHDEARDSPPDAFEGRIVHIANRSNPHDSYGLGRGKMLYGVIMYGAASPLILYGQEIATDFGFGDSSSHKLDWSYRNTYRPYFNACRDMTWLRRRSPALRTDSWQNVYHVNDSANVIAWERADQGHYVICIANFSNTDFNGYWVGLPVGGTWYETINTNASKYGGTDDYQNGTVTAFNGPSDGMNYSIAINLPKHSIVVLTTHDYDLTPDLDADNDMMEDAWEETHGLDPNRDYDATLDTDNDGITNVAEFLLNLNPTLKDIPPQLTVSVTPGGMELRYPTIPNRKYEILASINLETWIPIAPAVSTQGDTQNGELLETDSDQANFPNRYYRANVQYDRPIPE